MTRTPRPLPGPTSSGAFTIPTDQQTYVYRAYCRCGDLLYLGITYNLFQRFAAHRQNRPPWESRMVRLEWDLYPDRATAEAVERRLIRELHPVFNKVNAVPHSRPVPLPWPEMPTAEQLQARLFARARAMSLGDRL